jgi:hypothetical protein
MGISELLGRHQKVVAIVVSLLVCVAIYMSLRSSGVVGATPVPQAFYTTGLDSQEAAVNELFSDDDMRAVPFESGGDPAVKAIVYTIDNRTRVVGYLMKFEDAFVEKVCRADADQREQLLESNDMIGATLVKRPGGDWVKARTAKGSEIMQMPASNTSFRLLRPGDEP